MSELTYINFSEIDFEDEELGEMVIEALDNSDFTFGDDIGLHLIDKKNLIEIAKEHWEDDEDFDLAAVKKALKTCPDYILMD